MVGAPGYPSGRSILIVLPVGPVEDARGLALACNALWKAKVLVNFAVPSLESNEKGNPILWIEEEDQKLVEVETWMKIEASMAAFKRPIVLDRAIGVKGASFDGVLIMGGLQAEKLSQSDRCMAILAHMVSENKVIGAIGSGLIVLATSSLREGSEGQAWLRGRNTCDFSDVGAKQSGDLVDSGSSIEAKLREAGAIFTPSNKGNVTVDGHLVTATGRDQCLEFVTKFVEVLDPQDIPELTSPAGVLRAVANITE